jgi:hypothetical protein
MMTFYQCHPLKSLTSATIFDREGIMGLKIRFSTFFEGNKILKVVF